MVELNGITEGSPIGFMAAAGLLRVLNEDRERDVGLSWESGHACLHGVADRDEVLSELTEHMAGRYKAVEWTWAPTAKRASPTDYRSACARAGSDRRALAFLAAFATDTVLTDDGNVRPSRLDLTSGQQRLIGDLRKLAESLEPKEASRQAFERTFFERTYQQQPTFGWDPVAVRKHAHEARAPMLSKPPGRPGEVWLAAEALALHPVLPSGDRARTTGCERIGERGQCYFWGSWEGAPLNIDEVRYLRALDLKALSRRAGIGAVWVSEFGSSGKYGMLLPATREA